jgi:hypothetical protein
MPCHGAIRYLRHRFIMTDDQPIPSTPQTDNDADNNQNNRTDGSSLAGTPEAKMPPSHSCHKISCDKKRDGWDYTKFFAEIIGLGFLVAYTIYTAGIYRANRKAAEAAHDTLVEIQRQTSMIKQQLVGTQGAIVTVEQPEWDFKTSKLQLPVRNAGAVDSPHFNLKAQVLREILPGENISGNPIPIEVSDGVVPRQGFIVPGPFAILPWRLPKVEPSKWPGAEVFIVRGTFSYKNGFDETPTQHSFCYYFLPAQTGGYDGTFQGGPSPTCDVQTPIRIGRENIKRDQQHPH